MEELMLSIYIPTYNHQEYIGQALDGVLMQKTKYRFEVLVGEDCSTDNTREILKEYEIKYPGRFQMFYREHNMYGKIPNNAGDLKRRCKGKYIIALEGDDYWIDEYKIEKQIDFLESHPDYIAVAHNCIVVDKYSKRNGEQYPECKDEVYTLKHFVSEIMPGQLTTLMYRNYMKENVLDTSLFNKGLCPMDRLYYFAFTINSRIYCIQEPMSAYRHIKDEGTSFSATHRYNFYDAENWNYQLLVYARLFEKKEPRKYAELLYFRNLMLGLKTKECSAKQFIRYYKNIDHKIKIVLLYIKSWLNHHLLHKTIWV